MSSALRSVLTAIVTHTVYWLPLSTLAQKLGRNLDEITDLVAAFEVSGDVAVGQTEDGSLYVTLSPWSAGQLAVHPVPIDEGVFQWAPLHQQGRSYRTADTFPPDYFDRFSSAPGWDTYDADGVPLPILLYGSSLCPWPGAQQWWDRSDCPACRMRHLGPRHYCLLCDRWGLDK